MATEAVTSTETDKCREEISNTVAQLESLSSRLAALKEPLALLTDDQQCFYQVTLSQIASALRWPHLQLPFAEQEIRTLENLARNISSAR